MGAGADHFHFPQGCGRKPYLHARFPRQRSESIYQRDTGGMRRTRWAGGRRSRQPGSMPFRPGDLRLPLIGALWFHSARPAPAVHRREDGHVSQPRTSDRSEKIVQGARTSKGNQIVSPDGTLLSGYPFDGGFMQPEGIPTRDIGTTTSPPGNIGLGTGQLPLFWFAAPNPTFNPLTFNYNTDIPLVTAQSPAINKSTDISAFIDRGGKLIFYHGLSDSGPPWPYTVE
jgi:hypothetical protein